MEHATMPRAGSLLIFGGPGAGKTKRAVQLPPPVLFVDCNDGIRTWLRASAADHLWTRVAIFEEITTAIRDGEGHTVVDGLDGVLPMLDPSRMEKLLRAIADANAQGRHVWVTIGTNEARRRLMDEFVARFDLAFEVPHVDCPQLVHRSEALPWSVVRGLVATASDLLALVLRETRGLSEDELGELLGSDDRSLREEALARLRALRA